LAVLAGSNALELQNVLSDVAENVLSTELDEIGLQFAFVGVVTYYVGYLPNLHSVQF
jgi:siderophore synthetase component